MSFRTILKKLHLYFFLFATSELIFSGPLTAQIQSNVRRVAVSLGVAYGIVFFAKFPPHLRILTILYILLTIVLVGISYQKYGVALGSLQYMSISLAYTVVYGGFVAAWYLREINIKEIVYIILLLYVINQLVLGKIIQHQFNSTDRSTTVEETYLLNLVFCYFLINFLLNRKAIDIYAAIATFGVILLLFHRTVWVTSMVSIVVIGLVMWAEVMRQLPKIASLTAPLFVILIVGGGLVLAQKPGLMTSFIESFDDLQKSNDQGTAGWRHDQRELYWKRIVERPFFGWMYDGYDGGELAVDEYNIDWLTSKGTFIHSAYVHALYHNGLFGTLMQFGLIIGTLVLMWWHRRPDPEYMALFVFLSTGLVFGWSYQYPLYYWVLLGVGSYMACLVPVSEQNGRLVRTNEAEIITNRTSLTT